MPSPVTAGLPRPGPAPGRTSAPPPRAPAQTSCWARPAGSTPWSWPAAPTSTPPCRSPPPPPAPPSAATTGPTRNDSPARCAANATAATCAAGARLSSPTPPRVPPRVGVTLRPDPLVRRRAGRPPTLLDFRTTSRPDRARFLATTAQYDCGRPVAPGRALPRRAPTCPDVPGATRFLITGAPKKTRTKAFGAPPAGRRVEPTAAPGFLVQGRKKHARLCGPAPGRRAPPASVLRLGPPAAACAG